MAKQLKVQNDALEAIELSSGVKVYFNTISANLLRDVLVNTFQGVNIGGDGTIQMNDGDTLSQGKKFTDYNSFLIAEGVKLATPLTEAVMVMGLESNWLKKLFRYGLFDKELYDIKNIEDQEFLFLRYHAFADDKDFQMLTEKLVQQNG